MAKGGQVSEDRRRQMVAEQAFLIAERNGFRGEPLADWIEAEAIVDARLIHTAGRVQHSADSGHADAGVPPPAARSQDAGGSCQLDEQLALVNERLRALRKKPGEAGSGAREELARDIEQLAKLRDRFRKKRDDIRSKGADASASARQQAANIWQEITGIIDRVKPRKKPALLP
jgi:hypothetical protein